uniref:ANT-3.1 n=1 Tax=Toxocara canis TaxID=6265 RepID=B5A257_TOXCA|nr:ANT-3.1 [Toxocara canis]
MKVFFLLLIASGFAKEQKIEYDPVEEEWAEKTCEEEKCSRTPGEEWEQIGRCIGRLQSAAAKKDMAKYHEAVEYFLGTCVEKRSLYYAGLTTSPSIGLEIGHATITHGSRVNVNLDKIMREKILVKEANGVTPGIKILVGGSKPARFLYSEASVIDRLSTRRGMAMIRFKSESSDGGPCEKFLSNLHELREMVDKYPDDAIIIGDDMACSETRGLHVEFWSGEVVRDVEGRPQFIVRARKDHRGRIAGEGEYLEAVQKAEYSFLKKPGNRQ